MRTDGLARIVALVAIAAILSGGLGCGGAATLAPFSQAPPPPSWRQQEAVFVTTQSGYSLRHRHTTRPPGPPGRARCGAQYVVEPRLRRDRADLESDFLHTR